MQDSNLIQAEFQGTLKTVGIWPDGVGTRNAEGAMLPGYSVMTDISGIYERLTRKVADVNGNQKLSEIGKREGREKAHAQSLAELRKLVARADGVANDTEKKQRKLLDAALAPREQSDVYSAVVDVALAERLRSMDGLELTKMLRMDSLDEQALHVLATMPQLLTGADDSQRDRARTNLIFKSDDMAATEVQSGSEVNAALKESMHRAYQTLAGPVKHEQRKLLMGATYYNRFDSAATPTLDSVKAGEAVA